MSSPPLWKQYMIAIPGMFGAIMLGRWFDNQATLTMTRFRDKSALFGRELKPGEPPSWP